MTSPTSEFRPASADSAATSFASLNLAPAVQRVLADVGYETPSPIQAATIPPLLEGSDVLGQAQTGTGKTAAFALPVLSRLDAAVGAPQALVLTPTRELAIQVAEAFQTYAAHIKGFRVLPIYGGQDYGPQLRGLRRGVHVVVGTPGRIIDHIHKGVLDLSALRFAVLDEADEMLRMGFAEDVETILEATPNSRQTALFSATMPKPIRRIARTHLSNPVEVSIAAKTTTATKIRQRFWVVNGMQKLDALTRILEAEPFDAMIVFARTRQSTETLTEKLGARGFAAAAIHGDIAQNQRERLVRQLRDGALDILVATDVAARGLDVRRISHVLNYDIPYDTESYVHRIGRTGRAGRAGDAIVFVTPRERGMLRTIERATRQKIEPMQLPTVDIVNNRRIERFINRIDTALAGDDLQPFREIVERYEHEHNTPAVDIAAALARLAHGDSPLLLKDKPKQQSKATHRESDGNERPSRKPRAQNNHAQHPHEGEAGMLTYRLDVGRVHGAKPRNIIGAIANEADLDSRHIGRLSIRNHFSLIDLPEGMPPALLQHLKKVWVAGRPLRMRLDGQKDEHAPPKKAPRKTPGSARKKSKRTSSAKSPHPRD